MGKVSCPFCNSKNTFNISYGYLKEKKIKLLLKIEKIVLILFFMMDQFMQMQNLEFIMFLQKLLKMLFVNIRQCQDIVY